MIKTTKKDFDLFKKECQKWLKIFGIDSLLDGIRYLANPSYYAIQLFINLVK
jgi:hypothetical protein